MDRRQRDAQVRVAFVGADDNAASFRDGEVDARDARLTGEEDLTESFAGRFGEVLGIGRAFVGAELVVEQFADFFLLDMNRGKDDMAGRFLAKLDDPLAEVGINDVHPVAFEERVEVAFLGEHRLALGDRFDAVFAENREDDLVVLGRIGRPVNDRPAASRLALELFEVIGEVGDRMGFDGAGAVAKRLPFGEGTGLAIAFDADEPERLVMPVGAGVVLGKGTGRLGMRQNRQGRRHDGLVRKFWNGIPQGTSTGTGILSNWRRVGTAHQCSPIHKHQTTFLPASTGVACGLAVLFEVLGGRCW